MARLSPQELESRRVEMLGDLRRRVDAVQRGANEHRRQDVRAKQSRIRMRTLVLPAFAIFLMIQFGSRAGAPLGVHAAFTPGKGTSYAGPVVFDASDASTLRTIELAPGDVVGATDGRGSVLALGKGKLFLEPGARALVAGLMPARARLVGGGATLEGRMRVVTAHGIVDLAKGRAALRLDANGLSVTLEEGAGRLTSADGASDLAPGVTLRRQ